MAEQPRDGGRRRNTEIERAWRERIAGWEASGLSARAYCGEHGLKANSFYVWRRELRRRDGEAAPAGAGAEPAAALRTQPRFVALQIPRADGQAPIEIVLPGGAVVRVNGHADQATIAGVLRALHEARAC